MDCLEFNIHQLILTDLAANVGDCKETTPLEELQTSIDLITSQAETRALEEEDADQLRVFMSNSRVQCNIGFAELAVNMPDSLVEDTVPVLVHILRDVPYIDFDRCLAWDDWALPDKLVTATVSALLRISTSHPEHRQAATSAIGDFVGQIIGMLQNGDSSSPSSPQHSMASIGPSSLSRSPGHSMNGQPFPFT
ncbi:hypothetical protein PHLGIDRAFT_364236 [Phlebiopsis gigantea 11061_1 CR5-6]|uniref:Uncharacterized protein n=1 Tax=Phlebiopsis gigantea (strain 11061_1 CR5-6) TaxID=745531 RepID=A0A0C3SA12_PHLG1|nr:hypothetical protein PHLGIDRAFT_364236 [Phlebiopsis gigantea 11061_1 CR5-6]